MQMLFVVYDPNDENEKSGKANDQSVNQAIRREIKLNTMLSRPKFNCNEAAKCGRNICFLAINLQIPSTLVWNGQHQNMLIF